MKLGQKITVSFVVLIMLSSFFVALMPRPALAKTDFLDACRISDNEKEQAVKKAIKINFFLPGVTSKVPDPKGGTTYAVKDLPCFVAGLYIYFTGAVGILATVMIMYGGIKYLTSYGNQTLISEAKDTILTSLVGLVLTLCSFVILNFINPNIVALKLPEITTIAKVELPKIVNEWEGFIICNRKGGLGGRNICGQIWEDSDQYGCTYIGFSPESNSICLASKDTGVPKIYPVTELPLIIKGIEEAYRGNRDYECGTIVSKEGNIFFGGKLREIGTKCQYKDDGCLIFKDEGFFIYEEGDMKRGDENTIGSFINWVCQ